MFRKSIFLLGVVLLICVSCSDSGDSVGSRKVVILTPDEVGEIVLPEGAFENEVLVTLPPTTTQPSTTSQAVVKPLKEDPETLNDDSKNKKVDSAIEDSEAVSYTHLTLPTICSV